MTRTARVFVSGNSQAVRLPKEFRLDVSEVEIDRQGDAIILRPLPGARKRWGSLHAAIARGASADFLVDGREQPAEQVRTDLDLLFK